MSREGCPVRWCWRLLCPTNGFKSRDPFPQVPQADFLLLSLGWSSEAQKARRRHRETTPHTTRPRSDAIRSVRGRSRGCTTHVSGMCFPPRCASGCWLLLTSIPFRAPQLC